MKRQGLAFIILLLASSASVLAENGRPGKLGLQSWGPRVGVATDPDQVVGGVHFDLGEIVEDLRFEPNVELGLGDDHTVISFTAPVHYLFDVEAEIQPFAGGGVVVQFVDRDVPPGSNADDSEIEIGGKAIGGVEWRLSNDNRFRLELALHLGDVHDAQLMAAWSF